MNDLNEKVFNRIHDDFISYRDNVLKNKSKQDIFDNALTYALANSIHYEICEKDDVSELDLDKDYCKAIIDCKKNIISLCVDFYVNVNRKSGVNFTNPTDIYELTDNALALENYKRSNN